MLIVFLHGLLIENVFMEQPLGFKHASSLPLVCNLKKALYGLKQATRAWYERLSSCLHKLGFVTSKADTSLLLRMTVASYCYILIYVDNIINLGNSSVKIENIIHTFHQHFVLKDLGVLSFFLGVEVSYPKAGGMFLSQ